MPSSSDEKEEKYWINNAPMPLFSKMMLSMQDKPHDVWGTYKTHLEEVSERIKVQRMRTDILPIQDATPDKGNVLHHRKNVFDAKKATVRAAACAGGLARAAAGGWWLPRVVLCVLPDGFAADAALPARLSHPPPALATSRSLQNAIQPRFGSPDYISKEYAAE